MTREISMTLYMWNTYYISSLVALTQAVLISISTLGVSYKYLVLASHRHKLTISEMEGASLLYIVENNPGCSMVRALIILITWI
jgi:hypothetical protein